ncbi:MAG: hypothetical protein WA124_13225 [Smithella sp.]
MNPYLKGSTNDSGRCNFSKSSAIMWATSSSDPMSSSEFYGIPVVYLDDLPILQKMTDQSKKIADWVNAKVSKYDLSEFDALSAMTASEKTLARNWNSPEEDDAWAHL